MKVGLFFVYSIKKNYLRLIQINFLDKKKSTFLLKTIKKYLRSFSKINLPEKVKVIYYNKSSTLVPSDLFDNKNSLNYLKYNTINSDK